MRFSGALDPRADWFRPDLALVEYDDEGVPGSPRGEALGEGDEDDLC